jgi:hypothetical protein
MYRDQTLWGVEEARAEKDVTYDLVLLFRHERKSSASRYSVAKVVDKVPDNLAVGSERRQMYCPHGRPIALRLSAHIHLRERSYAPHGARWQR